MRPDSTNLARLTQGRLLYKLLAINVPMLAAVVLIVWAAIDYMAADYFAALIAEYGVSPDKTHEMFLDAVHRYLAWAAIIGLIAALALSYMLTRRMLSPLSEMAEVSRRIAGGDYEARVRIVTTDEIAHVAESFNHMAESLEKIEKLRKTMVADAAHELRTPLTNMRGYLEGLQDGVIAPTHKTFEMLHSEVLRLVKLAESLLELAKADAVDAGQVNAERTCLTDVLDDSLELLSARLRQRELRVTLRLAKDAGFVLVNPDHLRQVLRNLLDNAIQYARNPSAVTIRTERDNGHVKCSVSNEGPEISQKDMQHVFERFYRTDKSRSRHHGGAGIGLAIVKELVEAQGGNVGVTSENCRTTFWFTLPCSPTETFNESLQEAY